jgi:hypothetical protein
MTEQDDACLMTVQVCRREVPIQERLDRNGEREGEALLMMTTAMLVSWGGSRRGRSLVLLYG